MSFLVSASSLVTCVGLTADRKAPDEIVFIPEGSNRIFPLSHKDGIEVNVPPEKGEAIAATLHAALTKRMGDDVKPWTDIEHTRKAPASSYPSAFRYEKGRGIMATMNWSGKGRREVEEKNINYFSPEFTIGDDGIPDGLPERGPIGGLVAEPAFRKGMAIAAAESDLNTNQEPTPIMSKLIFAALAISAAAENAETEAVQAIEKLKTDNATVKASLATVTTERDELKTKITASEAAEKKALGDRADTLVKAAVADGRILPKDEDKQTKFRDKIAAGDSFAEEILSQLPKLNGDLTTKIITGADGKPAVAASAFEAKAQQLVTAGHAPDLDTAIGMVADSEPQLYSDYLGTLA